MLSQINNTNGIIQELGNSYSLIIDSLLQKTGLSGGFMHFSKMLIISISIIFIAFLTDFIAKRFIVVLIERIIKRTKNTWDDVLVEKQIFNNDSVPSRQDVIEQLIPYIKDELKKGTRLNQIMRHTLGLFHGQTGSSYWKRYLSENMCVRDADVKKIDHIMDKIKYNNFDTSVGQSA